MKKFFFYTLATVVTFLTFSCSKNTDIENPDKPGPVEPIVPTEKSVVLSGIVDATKVSTDNIGLYKWQASDKITVLTDNGTNREFTAESAGLTSDFSGSIPVADEMEGGFALYPASGSHARADEVVSFVINSDQTWTQDASCIPMYSSIEMVASKPKAEFKALGGALKLICHNIPSGATTLAFTSKVEQICGEFIFDSSSEDQIAGSETDKAAEKTIYIDFSANYSASKVFYIPLPVVTLSGGFTIDILNSNADVLFTVTSTKAIEITRNKLLVAKPLNCASATIIWKETFTGHSSISSDSSSPTSINTGTGYDAVGDSNINYVLGSSSSVQTGTMYSGGASEPELLFKSSNPFTV